MGVASVFGQCAQFSAGFGVSSYCGNPSVVYPHATVSLSNGTPPYSIQIVTDQGYVTTAQVSSSHWSGYITNNFSWEQSATLTVIDAQGCSLTRTANWEPLWPALPLVTTSLTCEGMLRIDWNGQFVVPMGGLYEIQTPCPGPFNYSLHLGFGSHLNGSLNSDWSQLGPNTWRYEMPAPAVLNSVTIARTTGNCYEGLARLCFDSFLVPTPSPAVGCQARFRLRTALAGALPSGTLMNDQLRTAGLVPTTEPYTGLGYSYVGTPSGQSIHTSLLGTTGNDAVVDWVVVEFRSADDPANILHSRPALLQRDGDVVDIDGTDIINSPLAPASYHVAVRHRNHLGVMTASPINMAGNGANILVDLRAGATATFGTDARVDVNGVMCLRPGDGNGNGTVAYAGEMNDRDIVLQAIGGSIPTNTLNNVYDRRDVNLDGRVMYVGTGNDRDVILQAVGGTVPTAVRTQQLP